MSRDWRWTPTPWLPDDPGPPVKEDRRQFFDIIPLRNALIYVVEEAKKHRAAGHDDHFIQVARVAQAALSWQQADERGNHEEAEAILARIPRLRQ